MDPQQQTHKPQGYAPLSEEESYSASSPNVQRNPMNFVGQANPVIVQGLPVMPMSYPAPMSNFEIYNPVPSQLQKLEECPYVCYKYWLVICIVLDGLSVFNSLTTLLFIPSEFLIFTVLTCIFQGWEIYQCIQVYVGIRDRTLEKVNKGVNLMKIYIVASTIVYLIAMVFVYEFVMEKAKQPEFRDLRNLTPAAYGVAVVVLGLMGGCFWFFVMLFPAMKVRDILKSASGGQANVRHYANV